MGNKGKIDVVLGLQWGDEGKGKIVDLLAKKYSTVCRFQGGPNAGHSIHFGKQSFVLHTIPSGVFRKKTLNLIGNGVVLDPIIFKQECEELEKTGINPQENVIISKRAHLILPTHRVIDAASEAAKGKGKIGSTLKGIGPTYMDKTGRNGLRVGDILSKDFQKRYNALKIKHIKYLEQFDFEYDVRENEKKWFSACNFLKKFKIVDSEYEIEERSKYGKSLAEGAQGTLLDVDFGSYPFVTSSSTACAGACIGLGVSPHSIGRVYGIFKAYCTRVGAGPFPTELDNAVGEEIRRRGAEFGATTGRARRTGWLDLPLLKYAIMINGVDQLIMMKADVLSGLKKIKIAIGYKVDGKKSDRLPFDTYTKIEPIYKEFKGWEGDISKIKSFRDLPKELKEYVKFLESELKVPIKIISVGAQRNATIIR